MSAAFDQLLKWRFTCAQQLIDSVAADPDRLLGHWFSRSLIPGNNSVRDNLHILITTLCQEAIHLKIELCESPTIKGSIHIFNNPNFAINIDMLTAYELKCLSVVVSNHAVNCFHFIYKNASTNTKIFGGAKQELCLNDAQRSLLIEKSCYHSLYMCKHVGADRFLQLKDIILSILLDTLPHCNSCMFETLTAIYNELRGKIFACVDERIHHSPTVPRLRESVKETPNNRRRRTREIAEPRNYFLGSDWFAQAYMLP